MNLYARFETTVTVRPDDIDLNSHLHFTKYLDYVLAARFEQMHRFYGMSMQDFWKMGYNWYVRKLTIEYKRAVLIGEVVTVRTWIDTLEKMGVSVGFEIIKPNGKLAAEGIFYYNFINIASGRTVEIPQSILDHYSK